MSTHRRVQSIVNQLEATPNESAGTMLPSTSPGRAHTRQPSLSARSSNSSLASLAAAGVSSRSSFGSVCSDTNVLGQTVMPSGRNRLDSQPYVNGLNGPSNGSHAHRPRDVSPHTASRSHAEHHRQESTAIAVPSTPQLEQEEQGDEFLPMSSPFSPNYSVSANNSPVYSMHNRRDSTSSNGSSLPQSPVRNMTAAERREHSRRHSRVHSRNLSVFFPRPEQKGLPGYQTRDTTPDQDDSPREATVAMDVPSGATKGWGFANGMAGPSAPSSEDGQSQTNSRRGHHHRHSMSHNFFPFLDGSGSSPRRASGKSLQAPSSADRASSNSPLNFTVSPNTPKAVPSLSSSRRGMHRHTTSDPSLIPSLSIATKNAHLPTPVRVLFGFLFDLPILTQVALCLAMAEIFLGGSMWIAGQTGESLAVTGLGYLVVFDGLAALSSLLVEGNARGVQRLWQTSQGRTSTENDVRYPFGTSRVTTLSHFSQCVYLIFSAVYVCKESIEHVLLLHGPEDGSGEHGAAHGTMGHGESMGTGHAGHAALHLDEVVLVIPTNLLIFSTLACLCTAIFLKNHASLTDAVGPQTYGLRPRMVPSGKSRLSGLSSGILLSNPFTLTILTFSIGLGAAGYLIPSQQLAPLDKVVALLQSVAMFYIAYPAAVATGRTLLQTAPPGVENAGPMASLQRVLDEIENQSAVVYLPPPHVWQLTPHPPPFVKDVSHTSSAFGRKSLPVLSYSNASQNQDPITIVATLNVQVKRETTDDEILRLTGWCREKCMLALTGNSALSSDDNKPISANGLNRQAELTVQVSRFDESKALQAERLHDDEHGHSHSHDRVHSHDHAHSHEHGHSHPDDRGGHSQTTSACSGHEHGHSHSDHSSHGHSHDHGHHH